MSYTYNATFSMCHCETVKVDLKDWYDTKELDNMTEEELNEKAEEIAWDIVKKECLYDAEDLIEMEKEAYGT